MLIVLGKQRGRENLCDVPNSHAFGDRSFNSWVHWAHETETRSPTDY